MRLSTFYAFLKKGKRDGTYGWFYLALAVVALGLVCGCSSSSSSPDPVDSSLAPGTPTYVTVTNPTTNSLFVSWYQTNNATSYVVYYSTSDDITSATRLVALNTSYSITGLSASTSYYIWVSAANEYGESKPNGSIKSVTASTSGTNNPTSGPNVPTGLRVVTSSSTSVTLSWDAVADATSYEVYYGTTETPSSYASDVSSTTYSVNSLTPATLYYFRVLAKNAVGSSEKSSAVSATTASIVPLTPSTPTNVSLNVISTSSITVSWNAVTDATSYDVYSGTTATTTTLIGNVTSPSTSYTESGLSAGTKYYFCVCAKNSNGSSVPSSAVYAITVPAAPSGLKAVIESGTSNVLLSWDAVQGATDYIIEYGVNSPSSTNNKIVSATSYTMPARLFGPGTKYAFCVRARNTSGTSKSSSYASINTAITYETIVIGELGSYTEVDLSNTYPKKYYKVTLKAGVYYHGTIYPETINAYSWGDGGIYITVYDAAGTEVSYNYITSATPSSGKGFGAFNYTSDTELTIIVERGSEVTSGSCHFEIDKS